MKKRFKKIIGIYILLLFSSTLYSQNNHIGLWEGYDQDEVGYLSLDSLDFAFFIIDGDTLGGKSFEMDGYLGYMKYIIDYNAPINSIDFIIYMKEGNQEIGRLPGIFKFDNDKKLILCLNFEGSSRPQEFNEDDTIYLKKIE